MIQVGERLPDAQLWVKTRDGVEPISVRALFSGRKVVLFGLPGAFTPTCSDMHLPGFVLHAPEIKGHGIETIACVAVNDAYVMAAWGKAQGAGEIVMLGDPRRELTQAMGLERDLPDLGLRSKRYAAIVEDCIVQYLGVEPAPGVTVSGAEAVLAELKKTKKSAE